MPALLYCYCNSNDYTEIMPDVIHCPNKDARARCDTPHASFSEMFLLHFMLASMRCISYTPHASSSEVFDYIPHASFSEVFLLHLSC